MTDQIPAAMTVLGAFMPLETRARARPLLNRILGDELAGGAAASVSGMSMEAQEGDNWCWAAVAVSVSRKYDAQSTWTQCSLATAFYASLGQGLSCCNDDKVLCDCAQRPSEVLTMIGHLAGEAVSDSISFDDLIHELRHNRPVCARIAWPGENAGGHVIAVVGARDSGQGARFVDVLDPSHTDDVDDNRKTISLEAFANDYDLIGGTWSWTYRTQHGV